MMDSPGRLLAYVASVVMVSVGTSLEYGGNVAVIVTGLMLYGMVLIDKDK